jgi:hypothetical protein
MEEKKEPTIVDISFHDEICITPPEKKWGLNYATNIFKR